MITASKRKSCLEWKTNERFNRRFPPISISTHALSPHRLVTYGLESNMQIRSNLVSPIARQSFLFDYQPYNIGVFKHISASESHFAPTFFVLTMPSFVVKSSFPVSKAFLLAVKQESEACVDFVSYHAFDMTCIGTHLYMCTTVNDVVITMPHAWNRDDPRNTNIFAIAVYDDAHAKWHLSPSQTVTPFAGLVHGASLLDRVKGKSDASSLLHEEQEEDTEELKCEDDEELEEKVEEKDESQSVKVKGKAKKKDPNVEKKETRGRKKRAKLDVAEEGDVYHFALGDMDESLY